MSALPCSDRAGWPRPYWRDRLALGSALVYALNRWLLKAVFTDPDSFVQCYLGDVLCLPACVPVVLWLQRRLGLRRHDGPPTVAELLLHWLAWSWCFEVLGPRLPMLAPGAVADPWDVLAYGIGGLVGAVWWRSPWRSGAFRRDGRLARVLLALAFSLPVLLCYRFSAEWRHWLAQPAAVEDARHP